MTMRSTDRDAGGSPPRGRVVAGFDGSANSQSAVDWAAREAIERGAALRVVMCSAVPAEVDFYGVGARQVQCLTDEATLVRALHPNLIVERSITHLDPRDALLVEAADADLLVLGASESGAAKTALLGSVARTATRRSSCPVVLVRGKAPQPLRRIVVGTDASSAAAAALDWSAETAARHDAELIVLHAREHDMMYAEAKCVVDLAVNSCVEWSGCRARGMLVNGPPADALIQASGDADLLVVGSRGRSGFKTLLFGSVALSVAEGAHCPVAVTHPRPSRCD